jgi:hypothetical protein
MAVSTHPLTHTHTASLRNSIYSHKYTRMHTHTHTLNTHNRKYGSSNTHIHRNTHTHTNISPTYPYRSTHATQATLSLHACMHAPNRDVTLLSLSGDLSSTPPLHTHTHTQSVHPNHHNMAQARVPLGRITLPRMSSGTGTCRKICGRRSFTSRTVSLLSTCTSNLRPLGPVMRTVHHHAHAPYTDLEWRLFTSRLIRSFRVRGFRVCRVDADPAAGASSVS